MMNKEKMMGIEDRVVDDQAMVDTLINSVVDQDFNTAGPTFAEIMKTKMGDALDQETL